MSCLPQSFKNWPIKISPSVVEALQESFHIWKARENSRLNKNVTLLRLCSVFECASFIPSPAVRHVLRSVMALRVSWLLVLFFKFWAAVTCFSRMGRLCSSSCKDDWRTSRKEQLRHYSNENVAGIHIELSKFS